MSRRWWAVWLALVLVLGAGIVGCLFLPYQQYALTVLLATLLSFLPVAAHFERGRSQSRELMVLAALVALSSIGRILVIVPGFKPVAAMTILTGIFLGKEAGFLVGALSAVVSNLVMGQGPWTPFQMFSWGAIGLLAGLLARPLRRFPPLLWVFGFLSGFLFSALVDVWTTLWMAGTFSWSVYGATQVSALPFSVEYAVSNVVFLLLLTPPMRWILQRLCVKYGLFPGMQANLEKPVGRKIK